MPRPYVSGKARQSLPRTRRWSLTTLFSSPPMYWPGVCTRGTRREMVSCRAVCVMVNSRFAAGGLCHRHNRDYLTGTRVRQREVVFYGFFRRGPRIEAEPKIVNATANNQGDTGTSRMFGRGPALVRWAKPQSGLTISWIFLYSLDGFAVVTFLPESTRSA